MDIQIYKPIIKWVGGKTQIISDIINKFPKEFNNYHEIFLGGGSVLFTLLYYIELNEIKVNGNIYAYDINEALIYMYKNIQKNYKKLYNEINILITEFNNCKNNTINRKPNNIDEAQDNKENYYYWIRKKYNELENKKSIQASSMFIFLNKTCFRGLYREGSNGFNVPYGNYKNPNIINEEHIKTINKLIKNVKFKNYDYNKSLSKIKENDFIYLDPPYAPENETSFVKYNKNGFNTDDHNNLFKLCNNIKEKFIMSNSNVKLVTDNFNKNNYTIHIIECKRRINSKKPQSITNEVIILNF